MENKYKNYIYQLGLISVILLCVSSALFLTVLKPWFNFIYLFVILYFFLLNAFQHFRLIKLEKRNPQVFHTNYMAWFGIKMFFNLSFVIIYALLNKAQALSFVLFFAVCYMVFTTFEVMALTKTLRSGNVK
jgi:hypothetical protein